MDWKYKHFHQQRDFQAPRDAVSAAARAVMGESLGWQITETPEGFSVRGFSFAHAAIANLRFQSAAGGTRVEIDLSVKRAGTAGFMLFDVGGYYNIQIRKWLAAIQAQLHAQETGQPITAPQLQPQNKTTACLFNGCLAFIAVTFGLWVFVTLICAIVGLVTGNLYLLGRGSTIAVHGVAGRIVSAIILLVAVWILFRILRLRRKS